MCIQLKETLKQCIWLLRMENRKEKVSFVLESESVCGDETFLKTESDSQTAKWQDRGKGMDETGRKITKIAREVGKFTVQTMKEEGIGTAEFDVIHLVRHNPGITQTKVRETLKIDKGAAAKRVASLENKGYLIRKPNPDDGRSQLLYATEKAESLKNSKAHIESLFYEWLLAELPQEEKDAFCRTLDTLYWRSKRQRQAGFVDVAALLAKEENDE